METNKSQALSHRSPQSISEEKARFMSSVYRWMTGGLLTTAAVAYFVAQNAGLVELIVTNRPVFWALFIAQIGSVIWLTAGIRKMSTSMATGLFFGYSALVGLTLSVLLMAYTGESLFSTFIVTAGSFAGLSAFGYITKRDLGPVGSFCMMGLWGIVLFSIASMIFPSLYTSSAHLVMGVVGIIVFAGLTAYDTQKIKSFHVMGSEGTEDATKASIIGALILYLDFINLFLSILRLTGSRK